jgi:alanine dehydrogenase
VRRLGNGNGGAAVRDSEIVVTAGNAREPVLDASWISPGTHQAQRRELPADLICRADLIAVDSLEQARMESGDLLLALDRAGWSAPRPFGDAVTICKSNGIALEDVAAAYVHERATLEGPRRVAENLLLSGHLLFVLPPGADF